MKRLAIIASIVLATATALAQESPLDRVPDLPAAADNASAKPKRTIPDTSATWKRHKYFRVSYAWPQTAAEGCEVLKSQYGVAITSGNTYFFPKKPIANMVKIGIDVNWMNLQFSKYLSSDTDLTWTSDIEATSPTLDGIDDENGYLGDIMDRVNHLGHMNLGVGMAIGPMVSVAPFALMNNRSLAQLRASIYFHYCPTAQIYLMSQEGDMEVSAAFANMFDFGGNLQWKALQVGVEGHWGKANMKPMSFIGMEGADKYTRRYASTRLYIGIAF